MENSFVENKKELVAWIEKLEDMSILQKLLEFKNRNLSPGYISEDQYEDPEVDFDQQFGAGMTSEELLENICAHLKVLPSQDD